MMDDDTYISVPGLAPARHLQRAGQWDLALGLIPEIPLGAVLRADILVDRQFWRLDPAEEASAAVEAIRGEYPKHAAYLAALLEYWRRLQNPDSAALADEPSATLAALAEAGEFGGWAAFRHAVALDNLYEDAEGAATGYARALELALAAGDLLLESYVIRHQAGHLADAGERGRAQTLLERSLQLRAALGARPLVAAAQATLAAALGDAPRADELRAIVEATAEELGLAWLRR